MLPRWNYWWLRHPRTSQEANRNSRPEERQFVRAKRTYRRLPNARDDVFVQSAWRRNVSWKTLRRTQYKTKPLSPQGDNSGCEVEESIPAEARGRVGNGQTDPT